MRRAPRARSIAHARSLSENDMHQLVGIPGQLSSSVMIKSEPRSPKMMNVQFSAERTGLKISMRQLNQGSVHDFEFTKLLYSEMVVRWDWANKNAFVLGQLINETVYDEIYCWLEDCFSRNAWLAIFETMKVRMSVSRAVCDRSLSEDLSSVSEEP
jgi:hypothetical protein